MRRYIPLLIGNLVLTTLSPIGPIATGNSQFTPEKEISQTQTIETGTNKHNVEQETEVEISSLVANEEQSDATESANNLTLVTSEDKSINKNMDMGEEEFNFEVNGKQDDLQDNFATRQIWTSPKNEDLVAKKLGEKAGEILGNNVRKGLKTIDKNKAKVDYYSGSFIDITFEDEINKGSVLKSRTGIYKQFNPVQSLPSGKGDKIGYGYQSGDLTMPIGTEGLSSNGILKFEVISNTKIRVERVKNKEIPQDEILPMNVSMKPNLHFFYESGKEEQWYTPLGYVPIFSDVTEHNYVPSLNTINSKLTYNTLEENWQWAQGDIDILEHISLEDSPEVQATPKKSSFDMPTKAPSTPEEYIATSNTMAGGTLTYTWIDQLDVNAKNDQSVRVKVVDQLDDYKHEATTTLKFKANPDKTNVIVKDSSLYQGQAYNPEADNFVSATDVNGNSLKWDDPNLKISGDTVDMKVPKIYNQTLTYTYTLNGETKNKKADYKVEVKEDKSSITTKDIIIYTGQNWTRKDNFISATDEDGKDVPWSDGRIDTNGAEVDTSKPNEYTFKYTFKGTVKNIDSSPKVTVKKDQTSISADSITYYVGDKYNPKDAFKSATDKDGNSLDFDESMCWPVDSNKPVDTSTPGKYDVWYGLKNASGKLVQWNRYVYVKEKELSLSVPKDFSFGSTVLGKSKKLYWDKKSEVLIDNEGNRKWDLTTKLTGSSNQDFSNYLKFKDQSFKEGSVLIDSGAASKNITNELTEDNFIYVDYSSIKSIRKDKATLEWTLSPSTKGVEE